MAYANAAKEALLGVPRELLERHGAVSDPIVRAMADGPHMVAAQHELSVLRGEVGALSVAEDLGLASLNRTPVAMRYVPRS